MLLHDYQDRATEILLAESECATRDEILENAKHLPGEIYLAISCIFENIEDYADGQFNKVEGIYCRQSHNIEHARIRSGSIECIPTRLCTPSEYRISNQPTENLSLLYTHLHKEYPRIWDLQRIRLRRGTRKQKTTHYRPASNDLLLLQGHSCRFS